MHGWRRCTSTQNTNASTPETLRIMSLPGDVAPNDYLGCRCPSGA